MLLFIDENKTLYSKEKSVMVLTWRIYFTVQGKGGVGKSVCSALLAQYKKSKSGEFPLGIDLDPIIRPLRTLKLSKSKILIS